jgi:hypothetical protein
MSPVSQSRVCTILLMVLISCSKGPEPLRPSMKKTEIKPSQSKDAKPLAEKAKVDAPDDLPDPQGMESNNQGREPEKQGQDLPEPKTPTNKTDDDPMTTPIPEKMKPTDICSSGARCLDLKTVGDLNSVMGWKEAAPNCKGSSTLKLDAMFDPNKEKALRFDAQGGVCNHLFFAYSDSAYFQASDLYIRFYWAISQPLSDAHVTFITLHDSKENRDLRWGGQAKVAIWNRESDDATVPTLSPQGIQKSFVPKAGSFHCVELHINQSKALIEAKIDGSVIEGLTITPSANREVDEQWKRKPNYSLALNDIKFGYESYGSEGNTVWYKDIVLATGPVGCR